ncbi:MAG: ABC transporter permease subunit [Alphaproteobacteria bacterium]
MNNREAAPVFPWLIPTDVLFTGMFMGSAQAAVEFEWWHPFGGAIGETVDEIAVNFNAANPDIVVKSVNKGGYSDILWVLLFHPLFGAVALLLKSLGIPWDPTLNGTHAMILVVIAAAWKLFSFNFIFFLAGLQAIPKSLMEAAAIDGAGPAMRVWKIAFPPLSPTTFYLLIMNIVFTFFDTFGIIHAVTQGGPGSATNILVYKVFHDGLGISRSDWRRGRADSGAGASLAARSSPVRIRA